MKALIKFTDAGRANGWRFLYGTDKSAKAVAEIREDGMALVKGADVMAWASLHHYQGNQVSLKEFADMLWPINPEHYEVIKTYEN